METELARPDDVGAGCGCAYPDAVDDETVERSNAILFRLRQCIDALPGMRDQLGALPVTLVATVGRLRIGIVHGDAESLAGWRFAHDALDDLAARSWLEGVRSESHVDVFASSHTCLPALRELWGRIIVVEQPVHRDRALSDDTGAALRGWPERPRR